MGGSEGRSLVEIPGERLESISKVISRFFSFTAEEKMLDAVLARARFSVWSTATCKISNDTLFRIEVGVPGTDRR